MKKELKAGDWVVCTAQKRPDYFADDGSMDYLLNKGSVSKIVNVVGAHTIVIEDEKKNHLWFVGTEDFERAEPIKQEKTLLEEYLEVSNKLVDQKIFTHRVINDTINSLLRLRLKMINRGSYPKFIGDSIEDIYEALRNHRKDM